MYDGKAREVASCIAAVQLLITLVPKCSVSAQNALSSSSGPKSPRSHNFNIKAQKNQLSNLMLIKRSNLIQECADIYLLQSHSTCFGGHSTHHQEH